MEQNNSGKTRQKKREPGMHRGMELPEMAKTVPCKMVRSGGWSFRRWPKRYHVRWCEAGDGASGDGQNGTM